jgi:hypothetical protein
MRQAPLALAGLAGGEQAPLALAGLAGGEWYYVGSLEGCGIYKSSAFGVTRILWVAKMAIDCDGSGGNPDNDPYYQNDTGGPTLAFTSRPPPLRDVGYRLA